MELSKRHTYELIWKQLQNAKFKEFYIQLLLERFQKRDRILNIFLVIATSGSISAWAIWQYDPLKWLWASVVAIAQIFTLVKPYLNYSKYIKELNNKYYQLQAINLQYEKLWLDTKFEKLNLQKSYEKAFELKSTIEKTLTFSEDIVIETVDKFSKIAKAKLKQYLQTSFN